MQVKYGIPGPEKLIYSSHLGNISSIKVNLQTNQRRYNEQLRLFASNLYFLSLFIKPINYDDIIIVNGVEQTRIKNRVIYVGNNPGLQLMKIMTMFEDLYFDLYFYIESGTKVDNEILDFINKNSNRVKHYNRSYDVNEDYKKYVIVKTDENGKELRTQTKNEFIYLLSDIRDLNFHTDPTSIHGKDKYEEKMKFQMLKEESYKKDMELQMSITKSLVLTAAYLRFRPEHFYEGITKPGTYFTYYEGLVNLMIYNDMKSTESRLVVTDFNNDKFKWDCEIYQHKMNYFNDKVRESFLINPFTGDQSPLNFQLGNKFETVMLMYLLKQYFYIQGITNVKSNNVLKFYTNYVIAESCTSISGTNCEIETNSDNEEQEEEDNYDEKYGYVY